MRGYPYLAGQQADPTLHASARENQCLAFPAVAHFKALGQFVGNGLYDGTRGRGIQTVGMGNIDHEGNQPIRICGGYFRRELADGK